jgi:replicative DNA helicase
MNIDEKANFSKFGKLFQENLCQLILYDRIFADQMREVLNINFLELKYLQTFVKKIFNYKEKYGTHPSDKIMLTVLRTEIENENELVQKQVRDFFARMMKTDVQDAEYIKDVALDFCKKQILKEAILKSVPLLERSSFEDIQALIDNAMKLGLDNDYGYDYIKDFEERFEIQARNPVTTGWSIVDSLCKGGLGRGELGIVIAPTGVGKSMALVHLGAEAIKEEKTVIHYTLELQDTVVACRYDSCITGLGLMEIFSKKDEVYDEIKDLKGKLVIKEYPTKSASTATIHNHLEKLRQRDISVDMVIVDYADLLSSKANISEKRHQLESIYEELRGIGQEFECPIWTASQTNRSGLSEEVITMEKISEAFNKCFVADFIFSLARTADDKITNGGRMYIAKNRNGPDGMVYPIFMDTSNVNIKVLPSTGQSVGEINKGAVKRQQERIKEIYKDNRKKHKET